jgi:hypothetical protein
LGSQAEEVSDFVEQSHFHNAGVHSGCNEICGTAVEALRVSHFPQSETGGGCCAGGHDCTAFVSLANHEQSEYSSGMNQPMEFGGPDTSSPTEFFAAIGRFQLVMPGVTMKKYSLKNAVCLTLAAMMCAGTPVMGAGPIEIRSTDISLQSGLLTGKVVNTQAQAVANLPIQLLHEDTVIATVSSDEKGEFAVRGLRSGGHVIRIGGNLHPVRFWGAQAAPPAAASHISIVVDEEVVRGQGCGDGCGESAGLCGIPMNPAALLLIGGATAATLAITLNDGDDANIPASP